MENGIEISIPTADEYVDRVFADDGYLAQRFPGYRKRDGQVAIARAIDEAIAVGEHVFAEGPTGTGKGLAYLTPVSYHAATRGKRAVIVTANISLTEQLVNKDLPMLASAVPWEFTYGLLKGKQNYLCLDKWSDVNLKRLANTHDYRRMVSDPEDQRQTEAILEWGFECSQTLLSGDKSDLTFEPKPFLWSEFSSTADECKGAKCPDFRNCLAVRAQHEARESQIIVTNYHMLFLHLAFMGEDSQTQILPKFDIAILDEAHKAAGIARDCFGAKITEGAFRRIATRYIGKSSAVGLHLTSAAQGFFSAIAEYRRKSDYKSRLKLAIAHQRAYGLGNSWEYFDHAIKDAKKLLAQHLNELKYELNTCEEEVVVGAGLFPDMPREQSSRRDLERKSSNIELGYERLCELHSQLNEIVTLSEQSGDDRYVCSIELDEKQRISLLRKPVDVGPILARTLFDKTSTVVCTSATLSVDNNFKYARNELGCDEAVELIAESPFDYRKQALLIVPEGLPSPKDEENFPDAVAENIRKVIDLARGKTLVLFTSRKSMRRTYDHDLIRSCSHRVLCQDDLPPTRLAEEFREDTNSVLFGLERFWAGLDVVGESLSVVVIEKLPFPTPDDPVLDVLCEGRKDGFFKYSIPRAVITFKQGFGRLIRSANDRGIVVVLDRRIIEMGYGKSFIRSLPRMKPISRNIEDIRSFLRKPSDMDDDEYYKSVFGDDDEDS